MELILTLNMIFIILYMLILAKLSSGLMELPFPEKPSGKESVSIVIALHNEEENVPDLLESLAGLKFGGRRWEVIFVDDRSSDRTGALLREACAGNTHYELITVRETPEGWGPKKYAVTQAVNQASGQIILLTDADGRPGPDWVQSMLSFFRPEVGMVLGYAPYRTDSGRGSFLKRILRLEYFSHAAVAAAGTGLNTPPTCVGTNLAYRKVLFTDLNGYGKYRHTVSGDDDLLLSRVRKESKWKVAYGYGLEAQVFNEAPRSWRKFYHQRLRFASKGFKYPVSMTLALMAYYLFNASFLVMLAGLLFYPVYWKVALLFLLFKTGGETRFLKNAGQFLGEKVSGWLVMAASPMHILYVVYFGAAAQFLSWKWVKNR